MIAYISSYFSFFTTHLVLKMLHSSGCINLQNVTLAKLVVSFNKFITGYNVFAVLHWAMGAVKHLAGFPLS